MVLVPDAYHKHPELQEHYPEIRSAPRTVFVRCQKAWLALAAGLDALQAMGRWIVAYNWPCLDWLSCMFKVSEAEAEAYKVTTDRSSTALWHAQLFSLSALSARCVLW